MIPCAGSSGFPRCQEHQSLEVGTVESTVPGQEAIGLHFCMCSDEEIREDVLTNSEPLTTCGAVGRVRGAALRTLE